MTAGAVRALAVRGEGRCVRSQIIFMRLNQCTLQINGLYILGAELFSLSIKSVCFSSGWLFAVRSSMVKRLMIAERSFFSVCFIFFYNRPTFRDRIQVVENLFDATTTKTIAKSFVVKIGWYFCNLVKMFILPKAW